MNDEARERLIALGLDPGDLRGADLRGANLGSTDLRVADLRGTNLTGADLRWANLSSANLRGANLTGADLRWANLSRADLHKTKLDGADLHGADLAFAHGPFTVGSFGKHTAIAAGGYITIGCERHSYQYWLDNYWIIGFDHMYEEDEISDYGKWIQQAVARQLRIEGGVMS